MNLIHSLPLQKTKLFYVTSAVHCAAGVICVSVDDRRKINILLGREIPYSKTGLYGDWCDFGGKQEKSEGVIENAAREFTEESMCAIRFSNMISTAGYNTYIKHLLQTKQYVSKFTVSISKCKYRQLHRIQLKTYYIIEIPWQPALPFIFTNIRNKLLDAYHTYKQGKQNPAFPFSLLTHPAVTRLDNYHIKINKKYLEKQSIGWWSLARLRYVVRINGKYKTHRFRKSFIQPLERIVQTLQAFYHY